MKLLRAIFTPTTPQEQALSPAAKGQYDQPVDAKLVVVEIENGALDTRCPEAYDWARSKAVEFATTGRPLTIKALADQLDGAHDEAKKYSGDIRECLNLRIFGEEVLASYLIRRANRLAEGVKPGAVQQLKTALVVD